MSFWNPNNKSTLYFRICKDKDDFYLMVNVANEKVWKLVYKPVRIPGDKHKVGLYELKWISFISNYTHYIKNYTTIREFEKRDGHPRIDMKYTTKNQFIEAFKKLTCKVFNIETIDTP